VPLIFADTPHNLHIFGSSGIEAHCYLTHSISQRKTNQI